MLLDVAGVVAHRTNGLAQFFVGDIELVRPTFAGGLAFRSMRSGLSLDCLVIAASFGMSDTSG